MKGEAPLPVQSSGGVDGDPLLVPVMAPGGQSSQEHVQLEANGVDEGVDAKPAPGVQLLAQEESTAEEKCETSLTAEVLEKEG